MTDRETLDLYEATGALLHGHFRLTSGLHSDVYLQSALVLQNPAHAAALGADDLDSHVSRLELGTTRLAQRKYAEAVSLLLESFAGLKQHESENPKAKSRVAQVLQRLVQVYDRWDQKDKSDEWRQKLDQQKKQ